MAIIKLWTKKGLEKQNNCLLNGDEFGIKYLAVGDGNGSIPIPSEDDTKLVNEVWRGEISEIEQNGQKFTVTAFIPESAGDFIIREMGIFDENNELLFVAQMDETPKKASNTGLIKQIGLQGVFELKNGLSAIIVDPSIITASTSYVSENYQKLSEKAQPMGYASLDESGKVPETQLPDIGNSSGLPLFLISPALYVDESLGLDYYLNGQLLTVNSNLQSAVNELKKLKAIRPSLFCTEEEWQAEKEASDHGQVGKFVLNETAGTLRLPAVINIQGVFDLQNAGLTVEAGLPNIKGGTINGWVVGSDRPIGAINAHVVDTGVAGASQTNTHQAGFSIDASRSNPIYGNNTTVQEEAIQYPWVIRLATGQETEVNIRNDIESIVPYTLFDSKYSEAKQYNASWELGGSSLSKSVYPTVYEAALVEYNSEVADGTTVELPSGGSYTKRGVSGGITVKLSTDETVTEYDWKLDTVAEILTVPTLNGSEDLLSDRYDDLELKASGSTYTAPANGWFWIQKLSSSTGQYLTPVIKDSNGNIKYTLTSQPTAAGYDAEILAPVSKGDVISIGYNVGGATKSFRFIYAKSNGSLYFFVASVAQNAPLANLGRIEEQLAQRKVVVETYKNGNSWYRVWSDGWCEQGGVFDRGSDITTGGTVVISLVHPFKDTHYTLMVNNGGNSTGNGFGWYVENNIMTARALSEFYVYTWKRETSNRYISWYACGY